MLTDEIELVHCFVLVHLLSFTTFYETRESSPFLLRVLTAKMSINE